MKRLSLLTAPAILVGLATPVQAYDVTENFSIGGVISGGVQGQTLQDEGINDPDDQIKGAIPIQPELSLRPTGIDEFFMKFGYAVGNGLNSAEGRRRSPFALTTWAADLEDDVEDINGRNRDYLLTGWYKHTFEFEGSSLGTTVGIIDATDYLDDNAYAVDEFNQFMNEAFVNSVVLNLASYDAGGAVEWESGNWFVNAVAMNVGKNDDDQEYNFFGATLGYQLNTDWGEGNYRITVTGTNEKFFSEDDDEDEEGLLGATLSFDQELSSNLGAFLRVGWQDDDAAVTYDALYSGGLNIDGGLWGRGKDNVGVGLAYLDGGNQDIDETFAFETYYRFVVSDILSMSADVQWMSDDSKSGNDADAEGWIFGLRATAEF